VRDIFFGSDAMAIGARWQEMYRSQYFEGGRVLTGAISAIDMALHDLVAKRLGVPVYQLLGGAQRELVPCFGTVGENFEGDRRGSTPALGGSGFIREFRRSAGPQWVQVSGCKGFRLRIKDVSFDPSIYSFIDGWGSNETTK
jgi:L-alanine-DL-glutamate epimerase-like enolase superfamily enzyme